MDLNEIINQVQNNSQTDENVKTETKRILEEASFLIENAENFWKSQEEMATEYENIKAKALLSMQIESEEQIKITIKELQKLKNEVLWLKIDSKVESENIENYVNNPEFLFQETDKNTVLKVLKILWENLNNKANITSIEETYFSLSKINLSLRSDIDVIQATRLSWISILPEEVLSIPKEFFQDKKNIEKLLEICVFEKVVLEIAMKVLNPEDILESLIEFKNKNIRKLQLEQIPIEILKVDYDNQLWLDINKKEEIINEYESLKYQTFDEIYTLWENDDSLDKIDLINKFLENHSIKDINESKLLEIILELNDDNAILYADNLLLKLEEKSTTFINKVLSEDLLIYRYLPQQLKENKSIKKFFIDKALVNQSIPNIQFYLDILEISDTETKNYLISRLDSLWEEKKSLILSDPILRGKLLWEKYDFKKENEEKRQAESIGQTYNINSYQGDNDLSKNEDWSYTLTTPNGQNIEISQQEKNIVDWNKEAKENLINFKETLDELNISKLWDYREFIFNWIKNKNQKALNLKDDYVGKFEIKLFLQTILKSIISEDTNTNFSLTKQEKQAIEWINPNTNYQTVFNLFRDVNKANPIIWKKTVATHWLSRVEEIFTRIYMPRWNVLWFRIMEFNKNIEK